ncbi:MAG: hypothetical protein RLY86_34 [Pseudomonadota bacterium]|jgi:hypothetical protein
MALTNRQLYDDWMELTRGVRPAFRTAADIRALTTVFRPEVVLNHWYALGPLCAAPFIYIFFACVGDFACHDRITGPWPPALTTAFMAPMWIPFLISFQDFRARRRYQMPLALYQSLMIVRGRVTHLGWVWSLGRQSMRQRIRFTDDGGQVTGWSPRMPIFVTAHLPVGTPVHVGIDPLNRVPPLFLGKAMS